MSVDECWQLVDTAERTRRHCIMLENCCYDPFALTTLNMARRGILGEIMHVEGAYIHDLRSMYFAEESEGGYHNHWGKRYSIEHTGNPYPTHGLGPACQILDIHRSDRMEYLVSMSTHQAGMSEYARRMFGEYSPEACQKYQLGDVNTTLIHTVKGKTIMLQYSVSTPASLQPSANSMWHIGICAKISGSMHNTGSERRHTACRRKIRKNDGTIQTPIQRNYR